MLWRSLQATSSSDKTFLHLSRCRVCKELPTLQLNFQLLFPSSEMVQAERHRAEEMIACERQAKEARMIPDAARVDNISRASLLPDVLSSQQAQQKLSIPLRWPCRTWQSEWSISNRIQIGAAGQCKKPSTVRRHHQSSSCTSLSPCL